MSEKNEDVIPFEEAMALKELGYDWASDNLYFYSWGNVAKSNQKYMKIGDFYNINIDVDQTACFDAWVCKQKGAGETLEDHFIYAPLYQEAFRWFREEHAMFVNINTATNPNEILGTEVWVVSWKFPPVQVGDFIGYDEVELESVRTLIKTLKRINNG